MCAQHRGSGTPAESILATTGRGPKGAMATIGNTAKISWQMRAFKVTPESMRKSSELIVQYDGFHVNSSNAIETR